MSAFDVALPLIGGSQQPRPGPSPGLIGGLAGAMVIVIIVILVAISGVALMLGKAATSQCSSEASGPNVTSAAGVPTNLIPIFKGAATRFGLGAQGWAYLAAINNAESTFGESQDQGVHSGANSAGAAGPMQIGIGGAAGDEWPSIEVAGVPSYFLVASSQANVPPKKVPGGVTPPSVYNEADAVYAAANYLKRSGAPANWPGAIFSYNHLAQYVSEVEGFEQRYYTHASSSGSSTQLVSDTQPASTPNVPLTTDRDGVVAATIYGSESDKNAHGAYGGSTLPADYASGSPPFAELGGRTNASADLLGGLPPGTALLIKNPANGESIVAYKKDFGYGQGSHTLDGHRYRIDLWWQTARAIGIRGSALVQVSLDNAASAAATASSAAAATAISTCGAPVVATGGLGATIVAYAENFVGLPYVTGGETPPANYPGGGPNPAFDCSGLVQYVYRHFGIDLPRTSETQYQVGTRLTSASQLQPGDLIFSQWDDAARPGHVAIYLGSRRGYPGVWTVEASDPELGVRFAPFDADYRSHVVGYTRVTQLAPAGVNE